LNLYSTSSNEKHQTKLSLTSQVVAAS